MTNKTLSRRDFLGTSAKLSALTTLASLGLLRATDALAATAPTDFKAIVCVFMFGGNDGLNTIVPLDAQRYPKYLAARGTIALRLAEGTMLPARNAMTRGVDVSENQSFGIHAQMPEIDALFGQGKVAAVLNVGNLSRPLSKADAVAGIGLPTQLFSHPDQTIQNQAGSPSGAGTDWGGRLMDQFTGLGDVPSISFTGGIWGNGVSCAMDLISDSGLLEVAGGFYPPDASEARRAALLKVIAKTENNVLQTAANVQLQKGIALSGKLAAAAAGSPLSTPFPGNMGGQMAATVKFLRERKASGSKREIVFCSASGFDNHSAHNDQHGFALSQFSQGVGALYAGLVEAGLADEVVICSMSEFGRCLQAAGDGTDHGWGSHHLVIGGPVLGGLYGNFPDYTLGGPDDATGRGALIPRISNQQFGATLGKWFGVDANALQTAVFKDELANFSRQDLGFMG
ncbi:MAG: DUF1501 domain-containing protein [Pseudomonadota bacterium]